MAAWCQIVLPSAWAAALLVQGSFVHSVNEAVFGERVWLLGLRTVALEK